MKTLLYWIIAIVLLGGGFAGGMYINQARNPPVQPASEAAKPDPMHIWLKPEEVEAAGIKAEAIQAGTLSPEVALFGTLQEDPSESFTVRAPAAGTLRKAGGKAWPVLGQSLADNTSIGELMPRIGPSDEIAIAAQRISLETQIATAQADLKTATVALEAAQASYQRLKKLYDQDQNVSARAVEEELAKVKTEEAHVESAKQAIAISKDALANVEVKLKAFPLVVVHGGETVEIAAQPEESVESGQVVLRVARLDHLLAAIDIPLGQNIPTAATEARIVPMNEETNPLKATRLAAAPTVDPKTKDSVLMFALALPAPSPTIRPGIPVTAFVPLGGEPLKGVIIPRAAVVRYQGKAWVYVWGEVKPDKRRDVERREVALEHPTPDGQGWFVMQGFSADDKVVTTGAAVLLSVEANTFGG